jgi:hypothetical protein
MVGAAAYVATVRGAACCINFGDKSDDFEFIVNVLDGKGLSTIMFKDIYLT